MRPTVDNVYSRWRSPHLKRIVSRVYLLLMGYPWLPNMSAFSTLYLLSTVVRLAPFTRMSRSHDQQAERQGSRPYLRSTSI